MRGGRQEEAAEVTLTTRVSTSLQYCSVSQVHLDIYFSGVDVANGRIRVRGSGPLPRNGFTVDRSVYTHTSHHSRDGDIISNDSAAKILGLRKVIAKNSSVLRILEQCDADHARLSIGAGGAGAL